MSPRLFVEAEPAFRTAAANPYNALLARALIAADMRVRDLSYLRVGFSRVDIIHLHWPDLTFLSGHRRWRIFARMALFSRLLSLARLRGARVVWTVHNVEPHEQRATAPLRARMRRMLVREVDGVLALSQANLQGALAAYPEFHGRPTAVTAHGHYRDEYDFSVTRAEARERLGIEPDVTLVVSVGQIRSYKNIPALLGAFRRAGNARTRLAVAGRVSGAGLADEIREAAAADPRVITDLEFQTDTHIALWLRASDLVALPYRKVENSGSALLALSADRPILVPALGSLIELRAQVGDEWVRTIVEDVSPAVLNDAIRWARDAPRADRVDLTLFDWHNVAHQTRDLYRAVHDRPPAAARRKSRIP